MFRFFFFLNDKYPGHLKHDYGGIQGLISYGLCYNIMV
jgi:hypothetical protein